MGIPPHGDNAMAKQTMEERIAAAVAAALAAQGSQPVVAAVVQPTTPEVASLAIADSAWTALENAVIGSFDTHTRDTTFLGAVLTFAKAVPSDWRGKPLPSTVVDSHADSVKAKLLATYGDLTGKPKEEQDRVKRTCDQKHSRAKALFTCSTILANAYDQGFKGGVVEAGKLCTELAKAKYNLAAVMKARAEAENAPTDYDAEVAGLVDRILNMKAEGDTIPAILGAKAKAQFVMLAETYGLKLKHGNAHRNIPLASA